VRLKAHGEIFLNVHFSILVVYLILNVCCWVNVLLNVDSIALCVTLEIAAILEGIKYVCCLWASRLFGIMWHFRVA